MKKTSQQKSVLIILAITSVIALAGLVLASVATIRLSSDITTLSSYVDDLKIDNARVAFCHDNQIIPCDDASITTWNDAHPEDAFNLRASTQ